MPWLEGEGVESLAVISEAQMQLVFRTESRGLTCQVYHQIVAVLSAGVGYLAPEITAPAPGGKSAALIRVR